MRKKDLRKLSSLIKLENDLLKKLFYIYREIIFIYEILREKGEDIEKEQNKYLNIMDLLNKIKSESHPSEEYED